MWHQFACWTIAGLSLLPIPHTHAFLCPHPPASASGGDRTVGVLIEDDTDQYVFFAPQNSHHTYLIDHQGQMIRTWSSDFPAGNTGYLHTSGDMYRLGVPEVDCPMSGGGQGGVVERWTFNGTGDWTFWYIDDTVRAHHDMAVMPDGNILMIAWEYRSRAQAIEAGRNPAFLSGDALWPDHVIEVQRTGPTSGEIVWAWHAWDHLVQDFDPDRSNYGAVEAHPELIDINGGSSPTPDWLHLNAIDYDSDRDQIILSCPRFGEVWIIDHSTTTEEAAGHTGGLGGRGGDLLYRWGNPAQYGMGTNGDRQLFAQHGANVIVQGLTGEGNILLFNNGVGRPGGLEYSEIVEFDPPWSETSWSYERDDGKAWGPEDPLWTWTDSPPESMFATTLSGAQRLTEGRTLICNGPWGIFTMFDASGEILWRYVNPVTDSGPLDQGDPIPPSGDEATANKCFRAIAYQPDFAGFVGEDLTPRGPLEGYPDCHGDITGSGGVPDGHVTVLDLLELLGGWGTDANGAAIAEPVDVIDIADLLVVLSQWGWCLS